MIADNGHLIWHNCNWRKNPAREMCDWRNLRQGKLCQVSGVISGTPYVRKLSYRERYHSFTTIPSRYFHWNTSIKWHLQLSLGLFSKTKRMLISPGGENWFLLDDVKKTLVWNIMIGGRVLIQSSNTNCLSAHELWFVLLSLVSPVIWVRKKIKLDFSTR